MRGVKFLGVLREANAKTGNRVNVKEERKLNGKGDRDTKISAQLFL